MTELQTNQVSVSHQLPALTESHHPAADYLKDRQRKESLHSLLGTDYDYARDSGLIDQFYTNPDTGEDGVLHTLSGDIITNPESGVKEIAGYHHEPSALSHNTYVSTDLAHVRSNKRAALRHFPYEPYSAHAVVRGYPKQVIKTSEEGKVESVSAHSGMFPKEYDALTVLRAIVQARDNRDTSKDRDGRRNRTVTEGTVPLLDGHNSMTLRLILDREGEKIVTAFPMVKKPGAMNLSKTAVRRHLGL